MQTREPGKRVNWIFVILLIIVIPLVIVVLIMMNTVSTETGEPVPGTDSTRVQGYSPDSSDREEN